MRIKTICSFYLTEMLKSSVFSTATVWMETISPDSLPVKCSISFVISKVNFSVRKIWRKHLMQKLNEWLRNVSSMCRARWRHNIRFSEGRKTRLNLMIALIAMSRMNFVRRVPGRVVTVVPLLRILQMLVDQLWHSKTVNTLLRKKVMQRWLIHWNARNRCWERLKRNSCIINISSRLLMKKLIKQLRIGRKQWAVCAMHKVILLNHHLQSLRDPLMKSFALALILNMVVLWEQMMQSEKMLTSLQLNTQQNNMQTKVTLNKSPRKKWWLKTKVASTTLN